MGKIVHVGGMTINKLKDLAASVAAACNGERLGVPIECNCVRTVSELAVLIRAVEQDLASKRRLLAALSINQVLASYQ